MLNVGTFKKLQSPEEMLGKATRMISLHSNGTSTKSLKKDSLSRTVSVHNLNCLTSMEKPFIIYCLWPTIDKAYTRKHLNNWQQLWRICCYDEKGEMRKEPIYLLGYSTDSASFSLSAAAHLMTPQAEETSNGLYYLGLCVDDEKFLAPYYWFLAAICYLDYDYEQRLFLKNLKYKTRQLTFWNEDGSVSRMASVQYLKDVRQQRKERGLDSGLKARDLILIYFCDQNSDACERLFTERVADLLDTYRMYLAPREQVSIFAPCST